MINFILGFIILGMFIGIFLVANSLQVPRELTTDIAIFILIICNHIRLIMLENKEK